MRGRPAEVALSLGVAALGVGAAFVTAGLPGEGGYAGIGPNFFPALVAGGLILLGGWLLAEALAGGWRNAQPEDAADTYRLVVDRYPESEMAVKSAFTAAQVYESVAYFYGPGSMNCMDTRGFPTTGDSAFPGEHNINAQIKTFIGEGGKVYCCRFGLSLHGLREEDLIEGVIPAHPLDIQDCVIEYARKGAIINSTYLF